MLSVDGTCELFYAVTGHGGWPDDVCALQIIGSGAQDVVHRRRHGIGRFPLDAQATNQRAL